MVSYKPSYLVILFLFNNYICINGLPKQKCDLQDAQCLKELFQSIVVRAVKGTPELGKTPLDPIFVPQISVSNPNLHIELRNATITKLTSCVIKKLKYNTAKSNMYVKLMCDANLDGQYEMKGKLMILPVEGNGKVSVTLRNALIFVDVDLPIVKYSNGKRYFNVSKWSDKYELTDKSNIHFENLFGGNELLAKAVEELIADNSNELILDIGAPIIKTIASKVVEEVKVILDSIPVDDVILN